MTVVADNIFNMVATALAEARHLELLIPQFVQLAGPGRAAGGFLGRTRYLDSYRFIRAYETYRKTSLSELEVGRAQLFEKFLTNYDLVATHKALGVTKLRRLPFSPRWRSVLRTALRKRVKSPADYRSWHFGRKVLANIVRAVRVFKRLEFFMASRSELPLEKFVFFPLHFQPEASTLVNGIFWANQISTIEQISKVCQLVIN
ncbi:MAG: hypothetical protein IPL58_03670 [Betaproteobacteria bacterium]|uniref:Uncharacterized protein n=1 Tax=Candidatus Proximibacter danicus TaxID=2954365 RepID=A0A9D7PRW0_9PROT|nr:hypothetical protein [Candidatus Proximibacter danicus]